MTNTLTDAESLLVIDAGSITTRALLFDVADGRYRFIAAGSAPTTAQTPFHDLGIGMRNAVEQLQTITGRVLIDQEERLILPSRPNGSGIDSFAATIAVGPPLRILVVGLLEDVSVESARRLAQTTYSEVLGTLSLNDHSKPEEQIDLILELKPDMILVAGGTEGGSSQSLMKLIESIGLACYLMPDGNRPEVLYAGNQKLQEEVQTALGSLVGLDFLPNVRPSLKEEDIDAAQTQMARVVKDLRSARMRGVKELDIWAKGGLLPSSAAFGRLIRFLSKAYASEKGVLGIDIGASATTLAAAFSGDLTLGVYPQLGLGRHLAKLVENAPLEAVTRWLAVEVSDAAVLEYIYNKTLYPASLPVTVEELAIEQALARQVMRRAVQLGLPPKAARPGPGLLPAFEPIFATGSVLTHAPSLAQSLLMIMDGLQPSGVTTVVLDQNHLAAALGAAAAVNPVLSVQVLDSSTFLYLGTVITVIGNERPGTPVLQLKMTPENGDEIQIEVAQGALETLPLPAGQTAQIHLHPLHRADAGMGAPGRGGKLRAHGGEMGVVIDARGRPLRLPPDAGKRRDLLKKWLWTLGG